MPPALQSGRGAPIGKAARQSMYVAYWHKADIDMDGPQCPLQGESRHLRGSAPTSASDPKRTSVRLDHRARRRPESCRAAQFPRDTRKRAGASWGASGSALRESRLNTRPTDTTGCEADQRAMLEQFSLLDQPLLGFHDRRRDPKRTLGSAPRPSRFKSRTRNRLDLQLRELLSARLE